MGNSEGRVVLSGRDLLVLADAVVKRWSELTREDIQKDIARCDSADVFDQAYLRAFLGRHVDLLLEIHKVHPKSEDPQEQMKLILEELGEQIECHRPSLKSTYEHD